MRIAKFVLIATLMVFSYQNCNKVDFAKLKNEEFFQCVPIDSPDLEPQLKFGWVAENGELPDYKYVMASPMVGDLDGDHIPELVFTTFTMNPDLVDHPKGSGYADKGVLRVINGRTGELKYSVSDDAIAPMGAGTPLLIDIDGDGKVEIFYQDHSQTKTIALNYDGSLRWEYTFSPQFPATYPFAGYSAADLDGDGRAEIITDHFALSENANAEPELFLDFNNGNPLASSNFAASFDLTKPDELQVLTGSGLVDVDGNYISSFDGIVVGGRAAAGDIDLTNDSVEVVVVHAAVVTLIDPIEGTEIWRRSFPTDVTCSNGSPGNGGPPNIGDFDGDGSLDIGIAAGRYYLVLDSQGNEKWKFITRDCSSTVTGSSLFDFNGDGNAEVIYNDELFLRIFNGQTGEVLFEVPNPSGTLVEYPVVADVDADGHSELVVPTNNYMNDRFYDDAGDRAEDVKNVPPGVRVFQAASEAAWVPTRSVWNQFAYFIHNVDDDLKATSSTPLIKSFRQNIMNLFVDVCKD